LTLHIPYLDIQMQYACNLACKGCISFSNYNRKGLVNINEGQEWLKEWSEVIEPETVCLFGGEPFLNPDVMMWAKAVRRYFPDATIKIITNIYYLKPEHVQQMIDLGNTVLQLSYHFRYNEEYLYLKQHVSDCITGFKWGIKDNDSISFLTLQYNTCTIKHVVFGEFIAPGKPAQNKIYPYNTENINTCIQICGNPNNPVLYKNRLYKCSPIANLKDTLHATDQMNDPEWMKYLEYTGYSSTDDLQEFVHDIGTANRICSMCGDSSTATIFDHYAKGSVKRKKKC